MRDRAQAFLLVGLMVAAIATSHLWAASADHAPLAPTLITAPPQVNAGAPLEPISTPLPRTGYDLGPALAGR